MNKIFYNKQYIDNKDVISVSRSVKDNLITNGLRLKKFEYLLKKKLNTKFAIACNSGTSALHLSLMAIKLKKNDCVIIPSVNFIASYAMSKLMGAKVYFADVSPENGQTTPELIENCIKKNRLKKIKLIITMYLGGAPENIGNFYKLKKKYNCFIIEDACHALGASYEIGKKIYKVGSSRHCDLSTFSFHPVKSITTGEGGAITTNNKKFSERVKVLRSHGILRESKSYFSYDITELSNNYRLSDINCALGISQLQKLKKIIRKRRKLYDYYCLKLKSLEKFINIPSTNKCTSAHHLMLVSLKNFNLSKKISLIKYLNKHNIYPQFHYIPLYRFRAVKRINNGKFDKIGSEKFFSSFLSLPLYYDLKISSIDKVVNLLKRYLT